MAGCWEGGTEGERIEEQWLAPRGGVLLGMSRTTRGDSLVMFEFMRVSEEGDNLLFTAAPSGQPAAPFRGRQAHEGDVTFANPAHDFPQRIRYRRAGADSLLARIEGSIRGQERGIDYAFRRVPCPT